MGEHGVRQLAPPFEDIRLFHGWAPSKSLTFPLVHVVLQPIAEAPEARRHWVPLSA
jgi:hypothetical protein